jgi:hypothetical protein
MAGRPPTLAEVQSLFQAAVVDGADDVLGLIPANSRTSRDVLFGVYRHAYVARLVEVVQNNYPMLAAYMGDAAFKDMARAYVTLYPSRHANARWYASDVPNLLERPEYPSAPHLREIALIERQLDLAFDAADGAVLDLAALGRHPPETWGGLVLHPHPSAAVLALATNAFDIWAALKNDAVAPVAVRLADPQSLLVWRRDGVATSRVLGPEERMLWIEAARGTSFGGLAEMAAVFDDPEMAALRVAQYLQGWLVSGLLSDAVARELTG